MKYLYSDFTPDTALSKRILTSYLLVTETNSKFSSSFSPKDLKLIFTQKTLYILNP